MTLYVPNSHLTTVHIDEQFTSIPVRYVSLQDIIKGFQAILDEEMDEYPESAFFNVGNIEEVKEKAKEV